MYIIYISLYFFETCQTISIYSSTECRVFHNVTCFVRKIISFYINDVLYLNVQFQGQRVNVLKRLTKPSTVLCGKKKLVSYSAQFTYPSTGGTAIQTAQSSNCVHPIRNRDIRWECVINTLRTGDADLRFYITTVQDG